MKYFRLVWTGLWRKKVRTIFTLLSVVFAFLLFGMLQGIDTMFTQLVNAGRLNVLDSTNPAGLPLPLADLPQIQAVKGVTAVTYQSYFVGDYQSLRNIVIVVPVDTDNYFALNSQFKVSAAQLATLHRTRTGALVSETLAQRLNWKVGDQIPVNALNAPKKDGTTNWTFDVVGTFDLPGNPIREEPLLIINYPYFDDTRRNDAGTVQQYEMSITDASRAAIVGNAIDNRFANSPAQTHTQTERANSQGQLAQIGGLDFFVEAIVGAAFAALLLLTGSTLMQSYRERVHEFAVMKTLGFTDGGVSGLVLSEAILLSVGAAVLGLLIAHTALPALGSVLSRYGMPGLELPWIVFAVGVGIAVLLALVSALPPAWRARRLSIIDALAAR
ncbi:MAG: ABC transporter permease [Steroidobacteraceae bacterium]